MLTVGETLSTTTGEAGPADAAVLPAPSEAVPAARLIPKVPSPVMPLIRTVGVAEVPLRTLTEPFAVPVLFSVTLPGNRLMLAAPL